MALTDEKPELRGPPLAPETEAPSERPPGEQKQRSPKPDDDQKAGPWPSRLAAVRRHPFIATAVAIVIVAALVAGTLWWLNARHYVSTDDAFIDTRVVQISPQVTGLIVDVPVTDNQLVVAGAPLVRIDPRDYEAAVAQAKAQLEEAQSSVANFDAQIAAQNANIVQAKTQVTQAKGALQFAQEEYSRYQALLKTGAGTEQRAQQASSDLTQKQAAFDAAQAAETAAEKQLVVLQAQRRSALAQIDAAKAQLQQAEINLSRTIINAPEEARVTKLTAAKGAYAQPGQALMALVPRNVWVTANFKETALTDMRAGQPVDIEVDAYPGRTFHGHVDSIQAGSGPVFSLLPPENATGNFVKVVQRVPVKIVFDKPPDVYLGPGMSVVPTVKVR